MSSVNDVLPIALYKKLQKQLEPIVEKLNHLEHATNIIEAKEGPRGATGNRGEAGAQGERGATGARGLQGERGETGARGIQGAQGIQGIQGERGLDGATGAQGIQGETGAQGERGEQGLDGTPGAQGERGLDGATGAQGIQGERGEKGDIGSQGAQGIQGIQGERGLDGATGAQGIQGIQGERGLDGTPGAQGERGLDGATGAQGIQGETGAQGERGLDGATGAQGIQGETGAQGERGPAGPSGKDAIIPDFDSIIEPFIIKTQTHIDGYIDKSEKTFKSWQSVVNSQLSTVGGGGEVWLRHLNDVDRTSTRVDGAFLKYNAATKKWVGDANISSSITNATSSSVANTLVRRDANASASFNAINIGSATNTGNYIFTRQIQDYNGDDPVTYNPTVVLTPQVASNSNTTTITLPARNGTVLLDDEVSVASANTKIVKRNSSGDIFANTIFGTNITGSGNLSFNREITVYNGAEVETATASVTLTCVTPGIDGNTITFPAQTGTVALTSEVTQSLENAKKFAMVMAIALG